MIDEQQAQKVRLVLTSSGWNDVIAPAIRARGQEALRSLRLSPLAREKHYGPDSPFRTSDEALRVMIDDCEWMAVAFLNELIVHDVNRQREELATAGQPATNSR